MKIRLHILLVLFLCPLAAAAQEDGYMLELGVGGGGCFYMGDANQQLYRNTNGAAALLLRYNVNPRFSIKADLAAAGLSGSSQSAPGAIPGDEISFSRTVYEFGTQVEWGFTAYGLEGWNGSRRLAPYGLAGIGVSFAPKPAQNDFAVNFPIGLGLRYKLSERVNLGLEWTMRFTSSDRLDVTQETGTTLEDPFRVKGKLMKNRDSYSFTMLYLTFDIFKRPCDCNDVKTK